MRTSRLPSVGVRAAATIAVLATALTINVAPATAAPDGANDWSCKPSAAHPRPVVLVHGMGTTDSVAWPVMSPLLARNHFCVFSLTYGTIDGESAFGGLTAAEDDAEQLRAFIDRVLTATGTRKIDIVAHSEGHMVARYYTKYLDGRRKTKRIVALAPMWNGSTVGGASTLLDLAYQATPTAAELLLGRDGALAAACGMCPEVFTGSPFLHALNAGRMTLPGIRYTNIMTRNDEFITPYTSGYLDAPHVTNHVVQDHCTRDHTEHLGLVGDPIAAQLMLNALDPAHARTVPCVFVPPLTPMFGDADSLPPSVGLNDPNSTRAR